METTAGGKERQNQPLPGKCHALSSALGKGRIRSIPLCHYQDWPSVRIPHGPTKKRWYIAATAFDHSQYMAVGVLYLFSKEAFAVDQCNARSLSVSSTTHNALFSLPLVHERRQSSHIPCCLERFWMVIAHRTLVVDSSPLMKGLIGPFFLFVQVAFARPSFIPSAPHLVSRIDTRLTHIQHLCVNQCPATSDT